MIPKIGECTQFSIKKDGVVNSIYAEKTAYPAIRSFLENLEENIGSDWINPDDMLGMNEAVQVGNARGCKVKFKNLMKGTVKSLPDEWDHFVDDFPSPSNALHRRSQSHSIVE